MMQASSVAGPSEPSYVLERAPMPASNGKKATAPVAQTPSKAPMYVHTGRVHLEVDHLREAIDEVTAFFEKSGARIVTIDPALIVARVPAEKYEATLRGLDAFGNVLDRRSRAHEVSAQYTDLEARRKIAEVTKKRLEALLAATRNLDARLSLLQEIKRLTEQVESLAAQIAALEALVAEATIHVGFTQAAAQRPVARLPTSPFQWVGALVPDAVTLRSDPSELDVRLPKAFVQFTEADHFLARASDASIFRASEVANEPRGSSKFWVDAVRFELDARRLREIHAGHAGPWSWCVFASKTSRPWFYLVGVRADGGRLTVIESFFPNQRAFDAHAADVRAALGTDVGVRS